MADTGMVILCLISNASAQFSCLPKIYIQKIYYRWPLYPTKVFFTPSGTIFSKARWTFIRLSHDGIALSCWSRRFDCNTASLHQAMRWMVYVSLFVACWFAAIGAFRSSLLFWLLDVVPSQVRFVVDRLLCFLIVGIQASGISIPLSLLMLLGWSLIWIASLTLRVYHLELLSETLRNKWRHNDVISRHRL